MRARSWFDDEKTAAGAVAELAQLAAHGFRRWGLTIAVAVVLAALLFGSALFGKRSFSPTFVLRVVEPDRDPTSMPRPKRQFAEYVRQAVFTSEPLMEIVKRHGLYPSLARKNPRAALESFREDIEVDVYQNYFVEDRALGSAPRSARLSVSYSNPSRELAVEVTRELGNLVARHEMEVRKVLADRAAMQARVAADAARMALATRRVEVATLRTALSSRPEVDTMHHVELLGLAGSLEWLERRQDEAEKREAQLSLGAALERRGIGMSFDVVDDGSLPRGAESRDDKVLLAAVTLLLGVPLIAVAVGAFAPRKEVA
jgi:hypothetical protein